MTLVFSAFVLVGLGAFLFQVAGQHPGKAWQAYLINFLLWSAVAQGAFLFSVVLHTTKARWGRPLQSLAESFAAFFPLSFILFLFLFLNRASEPISLFGILLMFVGGLEWLIAFLLQIIAEKLA